jgi:hypothetical protein
LWKTVASIFLFDRKQFTSLVSFNVFLLRIQPCASPTLLRTEQPFSSANCVSTVFCVSALAWPIRIVMVMITDSITGLGEHAYGPDVKLFPFSFPLSWILYSFNSVPRGDRCHSEKRRNHATQDTMYSLFSLKIESTRLRMPVISSKTYFDACFTAHIVAFYQTRHLRLFSGSVRKNWRFHSSKSEKRSVLEA